MRQRRVREGNDVIRTTIEEDNFGSSFWIDFEENKLEGKKETGKGSLLKTQHDIWSGWGASCHSLMFGISRHLYNETLETSAFSNDQGRIRMDV